MTAYANTRGYLGRPGDSAKAVAALLKNGWTHKDAYNESIAGECYTNPAFPEKDIVLFDSGGAFSFGPRHLNWYRTVASTRLLPKLLEDLHNPRPTVSGERLLSALTNALKEVARA